MAEDRPGLSLDDVRRIADAVRNRPAVTRILAFLESDTLAGFVGQSVVAAWIARRFPGAQATALFRAAPPARAFVVDCNPAIAGSIVADADAPAVLAVDWFDLGVAAPVRCPDPGWGERDLANAELVLLPGMLAAEPGRVAGLAEAPPAFLLPPARAATLEAGLVGRGMDPGAWFAVVDSALEAVRGGPVARRVGELGGRTLALAAPADGDGEAVERTAAAVAHARFVVAADPLIATLASAFRTPCTGVGPVAETCGRHLWNRGDLALAGRPDAHMMARAVARLHANTADCLAWRTPAPVAVPAAEKANDITLPLPLCDRPPVEVWE